MKPFILYKYYKEESSLLEELLYKLLKDYTRN